MITDAPAFYARHDEMTDSGASATMLDPLPSDLTILHTALNGVLIHIWKIRTRHPALLACHKYGVFMRHCTSLLKSIVVRDDSPLDQHHPVECCSIIDCRHLATLLCTIFQHRGIPVRAHTGFATYLEETHNQDHWMYEYWDARRDVAWRTAP